MIITGLPFPPYHEPKVKLKREYLDGIRAEMMKNKSSGSGFKIGPDLNVPSCNIGALNGSSSLTGADYYNNQAFRAVNQALGRVIRHKADYGAVLLLDNRFEQTKYQIGLSKWLRPHIDLSTGMGAAIVSLKRFFSDSTPEPIARPLLIDDLNHVDYEDGSGEAELNDIKKIVVVRPDFSKLIGGNYSSASMNQSQSLTQEDSSFIHPERIIKTVDLSASKNDVDSLSMQLPELARKTTIPCEGLESLYKRNSIHVPKQKPLVSLSSTIASAWSVLDRNNAVKPADPVKLGNVSQNSLDRSIRGLSTKVTTESVLLGSSSRDRTSTKLRTNDDDKSIDRALEFFNLAKVVLRSSDFELLGSKLKNLHSYGNLDDSEVYLKTSSEIIDIILLMDHDQSVKLLELFYQLLPQRYKSDVMAIGSSKRFEASKFKQLCQQYLTTADFEHLQKNISKAMVTYFDDVVALGFIKPIIDIWNGNTSISAEQKRLLFESMVRILPTKICDPATALWNNLNEDPIEKWLDKFKEEANLERYSDQLFSNDQRIPRGMNCIVCKNPICQVGPK